jgi:hypothetical protein
VTFEYETGVAVSGTQSLWMAGVLTPHQSTEALSLTAMRLNCRPLRAEAGGEGRMPWLRWGGLPPSQFTLRPHCLHFLPTPPAPSTLAPLPFKLHWRTHRDVDGGVHVPVSDEVALRTSPPTLT